MNLNAQGKVPLAESITGFTGSDRHMRYNV